MDGVAEHGEWAVQAAHVGARPSSASPPRPSWLGRVLLLMLFAVGGLLGFGALAGAASAAEGDSSLPIVGAADPGEAVGAMTEPIGRSAVAPVTATADGVAKTAPATSAPVPAAAEAIARTAASATEPVSATAEAVVHAVSNTAEPITRTVGVVVESTTGTVAEVAEVADTPIVGKIADETVTPIVEPVADAAGSVLPDAVPTTLDETTATDASATVAGPPLAAFTAVTAGPTAQPIPSLVTTAADATAATDGTDDTAPATAPAQPAAPAGPTGAPTTPRGAGTVGGQTYTTGPWAVLPSALSLPTTNGTISTAAVGYLLHDSISEPSFSPD